MCTNNPCKYCVEIISLLPELKYTDKILLNLGKHYYSIKYNYDLLQKYYLMAIKNGNVDAIYWLCLSYEQDYNYDLMKKYCLMAIKKGIKHALCTLGNYYCRQEKNYNFMKKYYLIYCKTANSSIMFRRNIYSKYKEQSYNFL